MRLVLCLFEIRREVSAVACVLNGRVQSKLTKQCCQKLQAGCRVDKGSKNALVCLENAKHSVMMDMTTCCMKEGDVDDVTVKRKKVEEVTEKC